MAFFYGGIYQIYRKSNEEKVSEIAALQEGIFEELNNMRSDLRKNIFEMAILVRKIDNMLGNESVSYYKEIIEGSTIKIKDCKDIFEGVKNKIAKIEEMKGMKIYTDYNKQFWNEILELSLVDSNKETWIIYDILETKEDILSMILTNEYPYKGNTRDEFLLRREIEYDKSFILEKRKWLYEHLKGYIEYYNILADYLSKINKRRKKIYTRKQISFIKAQIKQSKSYLD